MNNYRIYKEVNGERDFVKGYDDMYHVFVTMENIINSFPNAYLIAVEHNVEKDMDQNFIIYTGNLGRYLLEKKKILLNVERSKIKNRAPEYVNAIKLRRELLHKESTEVTRKFGVKNEN